MKGTYSFGRAGRSKNHIMCRRCGLKSFHKTRSVCASCGYGKTSKIRSFAWMKK